MWFNKNKPSATVKRIVDDVVENDPTIFCLGKKVRMSDTTIPLPIREDFDKLDVEVDTFRIPVEGETFITKDGCIKKYIKIDKDYFAGYRLILKKKRVNS